MLVLFAYTELILAADHLRLGVFPRRDAETTIRMLSPLVSHLEKSLGKPVELEVSKDFEAFWEKVAQQRYDIVHFNQYHYVRSAKEFGYRAILKNEENGLDAIAGALFVRKDSELNSLADLKGRKIVFGGGRSAMVSYIMNTYLLFDSGLTKVDYIEEFSVTPPNAVFAAYFGHADAGGAGKSVLELSDVRQRIKPEELKVLAATEPVAHLPWAVHPRLGSAMQNKIQDALLELNESTHGRQALKAAGMTALNVANDDEYDRHRQIIFAVTGEDYCQSDCIGARRTEELPSQKPLIIGVFPRREKRKTFEMFQPLAEYLARHLEMSVVLETHKSFDDFWQGVKDGRYQLIHANQYQYVEANKLYGYEAILKNEEFGDSTITPAIYVRKDSGIGQVSDLRGKKVIFGGGKLAMISYVGNLELLQNAGLKDTDYQQIFAVTPPNGCVAMYLEQADACGAATVLMKLPVFREKVDLSKIKVLAKNVPLSHVNWSVQEGMPDDLRERIRSLLLSLADSEEGQKILSGVKVSRFIPANDAEYNMHREILKRVVGADY